MSHVVEQKTNCIYDMTDNCKTCAIRLFNEKCYNIAGIGNPFSGNMIIISNIDDKAYKTNDLSFSEQINIMKNVIPSTGVVDILELCYITPLIKCRESNCEADEHSLQCCIKNLANEFIKNKPNNVLVTGSAVNRFLNCSIHEYIDKYIVSKNNIKYFVNYSPLIKFNNNNKFEIFKHYFEQWIVAVKYNYFNNYEKVML